MDVSGEETIWKWDIGKLLPFEAMAPMQIMTKCPFCWTKRKMDGDRRMFPKIKGVFAEAIKRVLFTARETIRDFAIRATVAAGQEIILKKYKFLQEENLQLRESLWKAKKGREQQKIVQTCGVGHCLLCS